MSDDVKIKASRVCPHCKGGGFEPPVENMQCRKCKGSKRLDEELSPADLADLLREHLTP